MAILRIKDGDEWKEIEAIKGDKGEKGDPGASEWGDITGSISNQTDLSDALDGKQETLVSGTNIKTINNESILGSGNINIQGGGGSSTDVKINGTSITSEGEANILTNGNYSANNKIANMSDIPTKTSDLNNDSGYITNSALSGYATTSDLADVQDQVDANSSGIISNSNKIGTLSSLHTTTKTDLVSAINEVDGDIPTKVSDLQNDAGYITGYTETDPVFSASAAKNITSSDISNWNNKSDFSGSYNDLTNKPNLGNAQTYYGVTQLPTPGADTINVTCSDFVLETGAVINILFNIPFTTGISYLNINNTGKIPVELGNYGWDLNEYITVLYNGAYKLLDKRAASTSKYGLTMLSDSVSSTSTSLSATPSAVKQAYDLANSKQDELVSGTNIKTINNESILGSGNITVGGGTATDVQINGTSITSNNVANILTQSAYSSSNKIATMDEIDDVQDQVDANSSGIISNSNKIGTLSNLDTTDKTNLVNAINEVNDISAMTVRMSANQTVQSNSGNETKLNFNQITAQVGTGFTFDSSNHTITVGSGISCIEVSAAVLCSTISGTGLRRIMFKLNNTNVARSAVQYDINYQGHIELSPRLIQVQEGDVIGIYMTMQGSNAVVYATDVDTYATVKKIK